MAVEQADVEDAASGASVAQNGEVSAPEVDESGDGQTAAPPVPEDLQQQTKDLLRRSREMERSEVDEPDLNDRLGSRAKESEVPGLGLLAALLTASLFCDLFHRIAVKRFNLDGTEARIAAMADKHPVFYQVCRWLDLATRFLLMLVLVAATGLAIWGILRRTFFYDGFLPGQGLQPPVPAPSSP